VQPQQHLLALTLLCGACGAFSDSDDASDRRHDQAPAEENANVPPSSPENTRTGSATFDPDASIDVNARMDCENLPQIVDRELQGGRLTGDTRLAGTVRVHGEVEHAGGSLRVEPGTTILMDAESALRVGGGTRLEMLGTPESPVRFCAAAKAPGSWRSLHLGSALASDSSLRNVIVSGAGAGGAAVQLDAHIAIENLRVIDSISDGLEVSDVRALKGLVVERSQRTAVVVTHLRALAGLTEMRLSANAINAAKLAIDRDVYPLVAAEPIVLHDVGAPYYVAEQLLLTAGTVVIEAGAEIRFGPSAGLVIGENARAELRVLGTAMLPVMFRGISEGPGTWAGVSLSNSASSQSTFAHLEIRDATQALVLHTAAALDHVVARGNKTGFAIGAAGVSPQSSSIEATDNTVAALRVHPNALVALPREIRLQGNGRDWIDVTSDVKVRFEDDSLVRSGSIRNLGFPFHIVKALWIEDEADVAVEPGTHFIMGRDAFIEVGQEFSHPVRFVAAGTRDKPIRFTGETSTPGFWRSIYVGSDVEEGTRFEFVEIRDAGREGEGVFSLRRDVPITNTKMANYSGSPVIAPDESTVDYSLTNDF
jgi:hypothetical protein